jgi:hypothetical protein
MVEDLDFQSFVRDFVRMFEGCVGISQSVKEEDSFKRKASHPREVWHHQQSPE